MTAVLTHSATDVLSHVAIRARSQGVLLATCFDEAALDSIKALEGKHVNLNVDATGAVAATEGVAPVSSSQNGASKQGMPDDLTAFMLVPHSFYAVKPDLRQDLSAGVLVVLV